MKPRSLAIRDNDMHKRIAVLMGTRPEAIKLAPVIKALRREVSLDTVVVSTGQHREMIDQVIDLFGIHVDVELNSMGANQSLASLSGRMLERIDATLAKTAPDLVLLQGDTSTVLCGALASFYRKIPVGHVEAGLRTGTIHSPFPEEANRRLTTPLVAVHFAPTEAARQSLLNEQVPDDRIAVTGNTVVDALLMELERQSAPAIERELVAEIDRLLGGAWQERPMVLVTGHRRENVGAGFDHICHALRQISKRRPDVLIVFPVHLNPAVATTIHRELSNIANIHLIPPQPYATFVALAKACRVILTDSGGIQEEAPTLRKPVLLLRDSTERSEAVSGGVAKLVGANCAQIVHETLRLLDEPNCSLATTANPFGDGRASERIVSRLKTELQAS